MLNSKSGVSPVVRETFTKSLEIVIELESEIETQIIKY